MSTQQTVLIIGASRGLGHEFVSQYAARGVRVIATVRRQEDADRLAAQAEVHLLEATREEDHARVAGLLRGTGAAPDVLIYNAGVNDRAAHTFEAATPEVWHRILEVNLIGALHAARHLVPVLPAQKGARAVFISSELGSIQHCTGGFIPYRASKAALNMMVRCLGHEENRRGVCCVALHPGWVRTDMGGPEAPLTPELSVRSMIHTIARLDIAKDQGAFLSYDGNALPW